MDFGLIERHPYMTGGIVLGGGFLLYLVFRGRGGSSAPVSYVGGATATDPNAAAIQAQQTQMQAYVTGLQLQGATQISLAQIGADVSRNNVAAAASVSNTQTAAELALGLGSQNAVVSQTRINADIQLRYIDAIVAAFTGHPSISPSPSGVPTPGAINPTFQPAPMQPTYPSTPGGTGGSAPVNFGGTNPGTIIPGGQQLVPSYSVPYCDPRDVACVMHNQDLSISYYNSVNDAQARNNRNQCLANAELSRGRENYSALVSACG